MGKGETLTSPDGATDLGPLTLGDLLVDSRTRLADRLKGDRPAAEATSEDDLMSFLRQRLASYKVPRRVLFFGPGAIATNGSGTKVPNEALVERARERLG